MATTRLVTGLWGGRRSGSFAGKVIPAVSAHPVGKITRLCSGMYGGRRNAVGGFAGKTATDSVAQGDFIVTIARRFARR